ncbi:MAG TPA: PASTA domain-containing protein, partial [Verrucomicrobiota bacterium]|nr:PASTA domain-containing protein [Verrucomicrobiota bacterium]
VFEPPEGPPHPGPFALKVITGANTPAGTYPLTVTCTNGALSATTNLTLTVTSDPGFRVEVEPTSLIVAQGLNGVAAFEVKSENGFSQNVSLTASGVPSGTVASFTPSTLTPTGSGLVQFGVSPATAPGAYPVLLKASDGVITQQTTFTLTVQSAGEGGAWSQVSAGDANVMYYGVIVGNVGGIESNRVFGSAGDGLMYEYVHNGANWSHLKMPVGIFADGEMHNMDIGPARGDGVNRLYIAAVNTGRVYEMSWVGGAWQSNIVATLPGSTDVIIGNGRNDGVTRMYVTWMSGLTEFTWNGSGWAQVMISTNEGGWVHGVDMGRARNDGLNRIYTANQGNGEVYEYSWTGANWTKTFISDTVDARNVEVGEGRNDGLLRVYVAAGGGNVYEFTWANSSWQSLSMGNAGNPDVKVQCVPAKARSDGLTRIYVAAGSGVFEYQWTGTAWQGSRLGDAVAYMYGLAVGDGLNKGTTQIYASSYDGNVYLFEWVPDINTVTVPDVSGLTESSALTSVTNVGLIIGSVTTASSQSVPAGLVISQTPVAGTQIVPGSAVNIVLSSGPEQATVPDVVGLNEETATNAIVAAGLTVGTISSEHSG